MRDYEELVKRLKSEADFPYNDNRNLLREAADAIEQLSNAGSAYGRGWTLGYDAGREESKPRWIPATERLPEDGLDILAYTENGEDARIVPANYDRGTWFDCCFNRVAENITYWMPLPSTEGLNET